MKYLMFLILALAGTTLQAAPFSGKVYLEFNVTDGYGNPANAFVPCGSRITEMSATEKQVKGGLCIYKDIAAYTVGSKFVSHCSYNVSVSEAEENAVQTGNPGNRPSFSFRLVAIGKLLGGGEVICSNGIGLVDLSAAVQKVSP